MNIRLNVKTKEDEEKISQQFKEITDRYIGRVQNNNTIFQLKTELTNLAVELGRDNQLDEFFLDEDFSTNQSWSLSEILECYYKVYPERYKNKKEFTKIEVNNMLFDLQAAGVIASYEAIIPCFETAIEFYGQDIFDSRIDVGFIQFPLEVLVNEW